MRKTAKRNGAAEDKQVKRRQMDSEQKERGLKRGVEAQELFSPEETHSWDVKRLDKNEKKKLIRNRYGHVFLILGRATELIDQETCGF